MKGDFTRFSHDPSKRYTGVLMQQGRVQVDADWNEQLEIQQGRERRTNVDVIGEAGLAWSEDPHHALDSFAISASGSRLLVAPGVAYVDGLQVELELENARALNLTAQPWLPDYTLPTTAGRYVVYLDVWERHVDAVEESGIREVALGGPDTATRKQLVWQVRLLQVGGGVATRTNVLADASWKKLVAGPTGTLKVRTTGGGDEGDPCEVPEEGGYSGLENQLYRVELHDGNFRISNGAFETVSDPPSFLWCRENGSISTAWTGEGAISSTGQKTLSVSSTGRDENLGFKVGQWVELTDRERELKGQKGTLVRLSAVDESTLTIDTTTATGPVDLASFSDTPRVRRWSSAGLAGAEAVTEVDVSDAEGDWVQLRDVDGLFEGIEVQFDTDATYRAGDYWMIPARAISGEIGWPSGQALPPHGPVHHHLMLAIVERNATTRRWSVLKDLRERVVPLAEQIHLFLEGGDGQSGLPGAWLRAPLRVGVSNGLWPVPGAKVRFTLERPTGSTLGGGEIQEVAKLSSGLYDPDLAPTALTAHTAVEVETDTAGVAQVWWRLGEDDGSEAFLKQRVKVELLSTHVNYGSSAEPLHLVAHFVANPSVARDVAWDGDCPNLSEAETVTEAIDTLCHNVVLSYVAGDGQSGLAGALLPVPLTVRVGNGDWGAANVRVRFEIVVAGEGGLDFRATAPSGSWADRGTLGPTTPTTAPYASATVSTDAEGYASLHLRLGTKATLREQQVRVTMLDQDGNPDGVQLIFNAAILSSHGVTHAASCEHLASAKTVFEALERLCRNPSLSYVAGEGQDATAGAVLPIALRARVSNGLWPVEGALVQLEILNQHAFGSHLSVREAGMLYSTHPSQGLGRTPSSGSYSNVWYDKMNVKSDANGEVLCQWMLGTYGGLEVQRVRATLLDADGNATNNHLIFSAQLVNRPAPTQVLTGRTAAKDLPRGGSLQWSTWQGFRFPNFLQEVPSSFDADTWSPTVDVEMEFPLLYRAGEGDAAGTLYGCNWIRFQGTISGATNNTLVWTLNRDSTLEAWFRAFRAGMATLGRDRALLRVTLHPSLMPEHLGRGSYDIESRYWLLLDPYDPTTPGLTTFDPRHFLAVPKVLRPS